MSVYILYQSPIKLENIENIFYDLEFEIKLLISYLPDDFNPVYIDEYSCSEELQVLSNKKIRVGKILEVLNQKKLNLYEYKLESNDLKVETVTSGDGDVLIRFLNKELYNLYFRNIIETGKRFKTLVPKILYEKSNNTINPLFSIDKEEDLINYLVNEQNQECVENNEWIQKNKFYFSN